MQPRLKSFPSNSNVVAQHAIHGQSMGTTWTATYSDAESAVSQATLQLAIDAALARIVDQMSTWDDDSVISRINRAEAGWYQIPDEFFHVLEQALTVARQTQGAYDPTVGKLVELWGFGPAGPKSAPPEQRDVNAALATSGWERTALNHEHRGVWQPGGLQFDLSSIAKGYGVDQIASVLHSHGVNNYLVELGGELKARGVNSRNAPWTVSIELPDQTPAVAPDGVNGPALATANTGAQPSPVSPGLLVALTDCAIATSGDYRRYFQHGQRRYAHTLDPKSGHPLSHNIASVSVVHPDCVLADALATALLCLGPEKGPEYARANHIAALFIHRHPHDFAVEPTPAFRTLTRSTLM